MYQGDKRKICATIEARMTSSRLPGKVLLDLEGKPALQQIVERLRRSRYIDEVVVATTVNSQDDAIITMCNAIGCRYYRGSEDDVLLRVLETAQSVEAGIIIEITGDCPVVDWRHVDEAIELFFRSKVDYVSNIGSRPYPVGFEVQVFPVAVLERVNQLTSDPVDHEHVSLYIYTHPEIFSLAYLEASDDLYHPEIEITLDTPADYELIRKVYAELYPVNPDFSAREVLDLLLNKPELLEITREVKRKYASDCVQEREERTDGE